MQVRWITADDTIQVMDLCRAFHAASPRYRDIPFSEKAMQKWLDRILSGDDSFFGMVATAGDGSLAGVFLAFYVPFFFSESLRSSDIFTHVLKPYQGSRAFQMLEAAYSQWAKDKGCVEVGAGVSAGIDDQHAGRCLVHLGYTIAGIAYKKEVAHGHGST